MTRTETYNANVYSSPNDDDDDDTSNVGERLDMDALYESADDPEENPIFHKVAGAMVWVDPRFTA